MADLPLCPNCQAEQKLAGESSSHWAFCCPRCRTARIISKPTLRGSTRLELALARQAAQEQRQREWEARPRYSLPGAKL